MTELKNAGVDVTPQVSPEPLFQGKPIRSRSSTISLDLACIEFTEYDGSDRAGPGDGPRRGGGGGEEVVLYAGRRC